MHDTLLPILNSLGLAALVTLAFSAIISHTSRSVLSIKIGLGLVLGGASVVTMLEPLTFGDGLIFDVRYAPIVLASAFGGWLSALIATVMAIAFRLTVGGAGVYAGILGLLLVMGVSLVLSRLLAAHDLRHTRDVLPYAAATSLSPLSLLVLPLDQALAIFTAIGPQLIAANFLGVLLYGSFLLRETRRQAFELRLRSDAITDPLTGLPNRRAFYQRLGQMMEQSKPVSVAVFDVDNFKSINDSYGHKIGDDILVAIGAALGQCGRSTDFVARIAGDEFAAILPISSAEGLAIAADRMRHAVQKCAVPTRDSIAIRASVSIGVAQAPADGRTVETLMAAADEALYDAKREGRNRVRLAAPLRPVQHAS
ncbi:MAG: diguanylate cyclase [Azospirillaceae bacterium]